MNVRTADYIRAASDNLLLAMVNEFSDLSDYEEGKLNKILDELCDVLTPPRYVLSLEGWWWEDLSDERKYRHVCDLESYPSEQAAIDECNEIVEDHKKLILAPMNLHNEFDGMALSVYEQRGSSHRVIQMWIVEPCRPNDFFYGDDAEHTAL